jgi:RNA polymerase subunit RPABC4/transcription elongation factor Spt4
MAKCPNCGAENLDDALFCEYCAKPIALIQFSSTQTETQATQLLCGNCRHPLYAESEICPFCGQESEPNTQVSKIRTKEQDTIISDDESNQIESGRSENIDSSKLKGGQHKAHKIRKTDVRPNQQEEIRSELIVKQHKAHKIRKDDIESSAKFCRKCGKYIKSDFIFCEHCGANIS